jgi:hypothetical protein
MGERKNMNVCPHVNDCWQDHKTLLFQAIEWVGKKYSPVWIVPIVYEQRVKEPYWTKSHERIEELPF